MPSPHESMMIGYDIHSDHPDAIITGGVWTTPLTALKDERLGRRARSSGLSLTNTQFRVSLASAQQMRLIAITHTNLTPLAKFRITHFADEFVTPAGNTGWLDFPGYPPEDPDFLGASIFHIGAATTAMHWLFEFDDQLNPAGFIELGRLGMPTTWQPPYNFDASGNNDGLAANTPRQNALGGAPFFTRRTPARTLRLPLGILPDSEMPTIRRIRRICNLNKQIFVVPAPLDVENFYERCFVATLSDTPAIALLAGPYGSTGFDLIEVVP
jgi:hypothetical protein